MGSLYLEAIMTPRGVEFLLAAMKQSSEEEFCGVIIVHQKAYCRYVDYESIDIFMTLYVRVIK